MGRQYPHSDEIQPRFAAWLWSIGGDSDPRFKDWAPKDWGFQFMMWIGHCKRRAGEIGGLGVRENRGLSQYYSSKDWMIINHEDFTEACWEFADEQRASIKANA